MGLPRYLIVIGVSIQAVFAFVAIAIAFTAMFGANKSQKPDDKK